MTEYMAEQRHEWFAAMPWQRKAAAVILFPFILPIILVVAALFVPLFGALYVWAAMDCWSIEQRLRARMRQCGRLLRLREARDHMGAQGGTLIVESPSLGWGNTRAWWTPELVLSTSPYTEPSEEAYREAAKHMRCTDWDRWCYGNYVSPDHGRAWLLRIRDSRKLQRRLKEEFPGVPIVTTWSALVHAPVTPLHRR